MKKSSRNIVIPSSQPLKINKPDGVAIRQVNFLLLVHGFVSLFVLVMSSSQVTP
jgi:hypothetical protein